MKVHLGVGGLFALALLSSAAGAADLVDVKGDFGGGLSFGANVSFAYLNREDNSDIALVTNSFAPGGTEILNANDLNLNGAPAIQGTIYGRSGDHQIEASFLRADWDSATDPVLSASGGVVQYASPIGNTFFPSEVWSDYKSSLDSYELNYRWYAFKNLSFLAGVRHIALNEDLHIGQAIGPDLNDVNYMNSANNSKLWGGQVGIAGEMPVPAVNGLSVKADGKIGLFRNKMANGAEITQETGPEFSASGSDKATSFLADLGIGLAYAPVEEVSLEVGYRAMRMTNVALAPSQVPVLDPATGSASVAKESVWFHGVTLSAEIRF